MKTKVIKNEAEYNEAMERLVKLMKLNPEPGTDEADDIELLSLLIETYEKGIVPMPNVDPVEAILFRLDQAGLGRDALIPCLGSKSKVSEILNRKRPLSKAMIRKLHDTFGIPLESLIEANDDKKRNKNHGIVDETQINLTYSHPHPSPIPGENAIVFNRV